MLSDKSFDAVTHMFEEVSGIRLGRVKHALVSGRLQKLAQERGVADLDAYVEQLLRGTDPDELVRAVDRLTTNETYFFREPEHFEALARIAAQRRASGPPLRVWSAASSSGEEAYSIAMVLADALGSAPWEVVGTDLSTAVLDNARRALYSMERAHHIPRHLLKRYCLKGHGEYAGQLLVCRELRQRVSFCQANLMRELPASLGRFDVIFLRNVLIYFDNEAKRQILLRVLGQLKPEGLLFTGHAESVASLGLPLRAVASSIYAHD